MLMKLAQFFTPFRLKAAGIHFLFSLVVVVFVLALMVFVWYPSPLFLVIGGVTVLLLIAIVDLTLGPLLTLVAASQKKSRRNFLIDLTIIVILQLSALAYGLHSVYIGRPIYVVFVKDRMELVRVNDISTNPKFAARLPEFEQISKWGFKAIGVEIPTDPKEYDEMTFASFQEGVDYQNAPKYYVPYENVVNKMQKIAQPIDTLLSDLKVDDVQRVKKVISQFNVPSAEILYLPVVFNTTGHSLFLFVKNQPAMYKMVYLKQDFYDLTAKQTKQ